MNYITRTVGNVTLYFDGEQFQQHQSQAKRYKIGEDLQEIADKDLQYADITPIDANWQRTNDDAWNRLTNVFRP